MKCRAAAYPACTCRYRYSAVIFGLIGQLLLPMVVLCVSTEVTQICLSYGAYWPRPCPGVGLLRVSAVSFNPTLPILVLTCGGNTSSKHGLSCAADNGCVRDRACWGLAVNRHIDKRSSILAPFLLAFSPQSIHCTGRLHNGQLPVVPSPSSRRAWPPRPANAFRCPQCRAQLQAVWRRR